MCIAPLISYGNGIGCKERGFTEVYNRLGDEDFVGNVLRLSGRPYASEGIPGEPSKSQILGYWIHSFSAPSVEAFLTNLPQAQEKNARAAFGGFPPPSFTPQAGVERIARNFALGLSHAT
jgi:hypothetical protein